MRVMSAQEINDLFVKLEKKKRTADEEAWLTFVEGEAVQSAIEMQEIHEGKIPRQRG